MKTKTTKTGTREWAPHSANCCTGCRHDCVYCYAAERMARLRKRPRDQWHREQVRDKDVNKARRYLGGRIMFPTSHDITDGNLDACTCVLQRLLHAGNDVVCVTKGRPSIVQHISDRLTGDDRKRLLWRFTIGGLEETTREFWEPGAPPFDQRVQALRLARQAHWQTSVSAEPLLEPWNAVELVQAVAPYVTETIWIGTLHRMAARVGWKYPMNHPAVARLASGQSPAAMRAVFDRLTLHLAPDARAKIRFKDSYQRALAIDAAGNPTGDTEEENDPETGKDGAE